MKIRQLSAVLLRQRLMKMWPHMASPQKTRSSHYLQSNTDYMQIYWIIVDFQLETIISSTAGVGERVFYLSFCLCNLFNFVFLGILSGIQQCR